MKLYELILKHEAIEYNATGDEIVTRVTADPDDSDAYTLLAITSEKSMEAYKKGRPPASALLCGKDSNVPCDIPTVRVENPRLSAAYACSRLWGYKNGDMLMIGITGTNGKTSTARFLKAALEADGMNVGFIGTGAIESTSTRYSDAYYSMTTPDPWVLFPSLKKFKEEGCHAVVMEVSSHALALDKVAPIKFDFGVFTNLSPEHLDFHGDIEHYLDAKRRLPEQSKIAVYNIDDMHGRRLYEERRGEKISAGVLWDADIRATHIRRVSGGLEYMYHGKDFTFTTHLSPVGMHNVYNSMLAAAVAIDAGVRPCIVKRAMGDIPCIDGRMEIIKDEITVIIDYAHTDSGLAALLQEITAMKKADSKIHTVFGCGGKRDKEKRPRMAAVAEAYSDRITVTNDNPRSEDPDEIISDICRGFKSKDYKIIKDRADAIFDAVVNAAEGDVIALVGKGAERYLIDKDGYRDFDERSIVRDALGARKK